MAKGERIWPVGTAAKYRHAGECVSVSMFGQGKSYTHAAHACHNDLQKKHSFIQVRSLSLSLSLSLLIPSDALSLRQYPPSRQHFFFLHSAAEKVVAKIVHLAGNPFPQQCIFKLPCCRVAHCHPVLLRRCSSVHRCTDSEPIFFCSRLPIF